MRPPLPFLNTDPGQLLNQISQNLRSDVPLFIGKKYHHGTALICGGSPSLSDSLSSIRFHQSRGGKVFALNNVHDWLMKRGITPDYHVILDGREENAEFVRNPQKSVKYLISSQCHSSVFEALKGFDVSQWIPWIPGIEEVVREHNHKPIVVIGGGPTVGLSTMNLCHLLGYRKLHLFGLDSSYREDSHHAYPQSLNDGEAQIQVEAGGRSFLCSPWMVEQAKAFTKLTKTLTGAGTRIHCHGNGLIPHIWRNHV